MVWNGRGSNHVKGNWFFFSPNGPTLSGVQALCYSMNTEVLSRGQSGRSVGSTTNLHLAPRLRKSVATHLIFRYGSMAWKDQCACYLLQIVSPFIYRRTYKRHTNTQTQILINKTIHVFINKFNRLSISINQNPQTLLLSGCFSTQTSKLYKTYVFNCMAQTHWCNQLVN